MGYRNNSWYSDAMRAREEAFERVFGPTSPVDQVIQPLDEDWQTTIPGFAFLRFPPNRQRTYWLYLTHGLSQPQLLEESLESHGTVSTGFGVEFAIATSESVSWTFAILEAVSSYIVSGSRPIFPLDRLPSSDLMYEEPGGHLLAMETPGYDTTVPTGSGTFHIIHLVGVTASEIAHAKRYPGAFGSRILECALHAYGVGCVTERTRTSITARPDFDAMWRNCGGIDEITPPKDQTKPFWKRW